MHADAQPADADPCARGAANQPVVGCVYGALDSLTLDGAWTLTGTRLSFGQSQPFSETLYMKRNGSATGACAFLISTVPIPDDATGFNMYIDNTVANYAASGNYPHTHSTSQFLCVRDTDNALYYKSTNMVSMPAQDETIEGVLTR